MAAGTRMARTTRRVWAETDRLPGTWVCAGPAAVGGPCRWERGVCLASGSHSEPDDGGAGSSFHDS